MTTQRITTRASKLLNYGGTLPQLSSGPFGRGNILFLIYNMKEYSRTEKRRLRELAEIAYERELKKSLTVLAATFDQWKSSKITSLELSQLLHEFDRGESRDLWSMYDTPEHDMVVARALVKGILTNKDVGEELAGVLQPHIRFYEGEASKRN